MLQLGKSETAFLDIAKVKRWDAWLIRPVPKPRRSQKAKKLSFGKLGRRHPRLANFRYGNWDFRRDAYPSNLWNWVRRLSDPCEIGWDAYPSICEIGWDAYPSICEIGRDAYPSPHNREFQQFYQLFINFYQHFINFLLTLSTFYQSFINFLSTFYQLFINVLSTLSTFFLSTLSTFYQLFINLTVSTFINFLSMFYQVLSMFYQVFIKFLSTWKKWSLLTFVRHCLHCCQVILCSWFYQLWQGQSPTRYSQRRRPGKSGIHAQSIWWIACTSGTETSKEQKIQRPCGTQFNICFLFFFCHSACNQGQKRERTGRRLAGALMFLPLLDAFHTCQSLRKVHWRQDQRREEDTKDQHKQWNAILIEVWCDHEALLCNLSGHNGHNRADYIRELMSLGFSFVESVKKYGTCPAVIQRKQQREAKKAASLAKKAEVPPRRAKRKKAPSKVPPLQDEKPQEVDSDNDSDIGASERFWMPSFKSISHMPERTAATS